MANWRQQQEERERVAKEREEEERRKKEQKIKQLLLHASTPSNSTSAPSSPHLEPRHQHHPHVYEPHHAKSDPEDTRPNKVDEEAVGGWTKALKSKETTLTSDQAPNKPAQAHTFLNQERPGKEHQHEPHGDDDSAAALVEQLRSQLAKRDEEVKMLKEAYKERMREKEEEFKKLWAAQNEAEGLAHKLNEAESRAKTKEAEAKRLQEQVHQLDLLVQSLKKEKKKKTTKPAKKPSKKPGHGKHSDIEPQLRAEMKGKKVIALYNFKGNTGDGELSFVEGDVIVVLEQVNEGWWEGELTNGERGIFPFNYVQPLVIFSSHASKVEHSDDQHHQHHNHQEEGEDDDQPAPPKMSTLEKAAYAKQKIEARYNELAKSILASSGSTEVKTRAEDSPRDLQGKNDHRTVGSAADEEKREHEKNEEEAHDGRRGEGERKKEEVEEGEEADDQGEAETSHGEEGEHNKEEEEKDGDAEEEEEEEGEELKRGVALFDFEAQNEGELSFKKGDEILIGPREEDGEWLYGYLHDREGHFPVSYVSIH